MRFIVEKDVSQNTIDQVYAIVSDYTKDFFTADYPESVRIDMRFQRAACLWAGNEIVSCIVFTCLDGSAHITTMATKRAYRGNGHGGALMRQFVDHARALGLSSTELYTFSPASVPAYAATIGFYQSEGFRIVGEHPDLWERGTITLKMRIQW